MLIIQKLNAKILSMEYDKAAQRGVWTNGIYLGLNGSEEKISISYHGFIFRSLAVLVLCNISRIRILRGLPFYFKCFLNENHGANPPDKFFFFQMLVTTIIFCLHLEY